MGLKNKISYHTRLFVLLLAFSWLLMGCFIVFQYSRERLFKAEKLDSQLQLFNMRLLDALEQNIEPQLFIAKNPLPYEGLRVSIIEDDGDVLYDNMVDIAGMGNHADRPEIIDAKRNGTGYSYIRHSETAGQDYFYSAMEHNRVLVRTAVPASVSLTEVLAADRGFLWFMLGVTLVMSIAGYFATRRLGKTISRLNLFASRVQRGEEIADDEPFPHNELGDISNHIVSLYVQLQQTTRKLRTEHERALHEEQEKIRIKKQLTNNINHELKTPLAVIQATLETLMNHPEIDAVRRQDFVAQCYANSERLCRMLNDVATITRMDEAKDLITMEPFVLNRVVEEVADEMALSLQNQGMELKIDMPDRIEMNGNQTLVGSLFRNLIDNSIAYSGGHKIEIRVLRNAATECEISFSDDGQGVEAHHLDHLFERFYRIDKGRSRKLGGTGLGLSIVKNTVVLHGGVIRARLTAAGGLEFVFSFNK